LPVTIKSDNWTEKAGILNNINWIQFLQLHVLANSLSLFPTKTDLF